MISTDTKKKALTLHQRGKSIKDIARTCDVHRNTISRWVSRPTSTATNRNPGRKLGDQRILNVINESKCLLHMLTHTPSSMGFSERLWNRQNIQKLIKNISQIDLSKKTTLNYINRWGFSATKANTFRVECINKIVFDSDNKILPRSIPWLEAYQLKDNRLLYQGVRVYFLKIIKVQLKDLPITDSDIKAYYKNESIKGINKSISLITAQAEKGPLFMKFYAGNIRANILIDFYTGLLTTTTQKILLVGEKIDKHDTNALKHWFSCQGERFEYFILPN